MISKLLKCPATFWNIWAVLWLWSQKFTAALHFINISLTAGTSSPSSILTRTGRATAEPAPASEQYSDSHQGSDNQSMGSDLKRLLNLRLVSLRDKLEALVKSFYDMDELKDKPSESSEDDNQRLSNEEEITALESEENIMLENQKGRTISVWVKGNRRGRSRCVFWGCTNKVERSTREAQTHCSRVSAKVIRTEEITVKRFTWWFMKKMSKWCLDVQVELFFWVEGRCSLVSVRVFTGCSSQVKWRQSDTQLRLVETLTWKRVSL